MLEAPPGWAWGPLLTVVAMALLVLSRLLSAGDSLTVFDIDAILLAAVTIAVAACYQLWRRYRE